MAKVDTLIRLLHDHPSYVVGALYDHLRLCGLFRAMPDETYLKVTYWFHFLKFLDLKHPKTFNEKLQWLKLHNRNIDYVRMVDKFEVKKYVADKIGEEYIIPTLGVWERVEDIAWNALPKQFVLKCTHDSGSVCVCKDVGIFDKISAEKKLAKGLKRNLFYWGREWPYKYVKPRIIAEKYLDGGCDDLVDYKLMCFNGKVICSFVCSERFTSDRLKVTFFDREWNVMPFTRQYPISSKPIPCPSSYHKMLEMAEALAIGIPFVRIDFYEVKGHPYFGEMTFFPGDGLERFDPEEWDYRLGEWITLPGE